MSRVTIIDQLYHKRLNKRAITFDQITQPAPLSYFFTQQDVMSLNKIAKSNKLAARPKEKYKLITDIMACRGFKKLASGTNRIVFKYMEDQSFIIKVALDSVGLTDNPSEMYNQRYLKPYCTKVFEVSQCGTIGMFERVNPITSREEFASVAEDIYSIIVNQFVGKYVLNDIGTNFFMNWGVRVGAYPVILDFPYTFELDGGKLNCNSPDAYSRFNICGGEIDYDDGFNNLICKRCGRIFNARDLKKASVAEDSGILITGKKGDISMKVKIMRGEQVVQSVNSEKSSTTYKPMKTDRKTGKRTPMKTPYERRQESRVPHITVKVTPSESVLLDEELSIESSFDNVVADVAPLKVRTHLLHVNTVTREDRLTKSMPKQANPVKSNDDDKYNKNTSVNDQPKVDTINASKEIIPTPCEILDVSNDVSELKDASTKHLHLQERVGDCVDEICVENTEEPEEEPVIHAMDYVVLHPSSCANIDTGKYEKFVKDETCTEEY